MKNERIIGLVSGLLLMIFASGSGNLLSAAEKFKLDPVHSTVGFSVKHLVISTVKGTFSDVSGIILYDEKDISKSSVDVIIKVASINTNNEKRDGHLRTGDFFDAENHPDITFKSTSIGKEGDGYLMTGDLTIRGVTKEVTLPFEITGRVTDPWGNIRMGADTHLKINRQDYGVSWSQTMDGGGLVVSDEVKIEISVEGVLEK